MIHARQEDGVHRNELSASQVKKRFDIVRSVLMRRFGTQGHHRDRKHVLRLGLLIALLLRTASACFSMGKWWTEDSGPYFDMASAILVGAPMGYFPNGYPLTIAILQMIVPHDLVAPSLIVGNILLSTLIVVFTYQLAMSIGGRVMAMTAALIMTFYPNQLNYVGKLMTEVPAGFFLVLAALLVFRHRHLLSGLSLGMAIWFRTPLHLFSASSVSLCSK